jgi:hypothetical protein
VNVFLRKTFKFLNRNKNSSPYLSGDYFRSVSDVSVFDKKDLDVNVEKLGSAKVIFIGEGRVEDFLSEYDSYIEAKVLILGNADRDYSFPIKDLPKSVERVFAQNLDFVDERFHLLPIGLENLSISVNGFQRYVDKRFISEAKEPKILVGPLSNTHPERLELTALSKLNLSNVVFQEKRMEPHALASYSSSFQYVACPRGNGLDTHRFWETLYRGSIPIVKASPWSQQIVNLGIPICEIEDWKADSLVSVFEKGGFKEFDPQSIPSLWVKFWNRIIFDGL